MNNILETDGLLIAARLKKKRESQGMSLERAAQRAEIHPDVLSDIENGTCILSPQMLMTFAVAYNSQICELVGDMPIYPTEEAALDDYIDGKAAEGYIAHVLGIDILTLRNRAARHNPIAYWNRW